MDEVFDLIAKVFLRNNRPQVSLAAELRQNRQIDGGLAAAFDRAANELDQGEFKMFLTWATTIYAENRDDFRDLHNKIDNLRNHGQSSFDNPPRWGSDRELGQIMWNEHIRGKIEVWLTNYPGIRKLQLGYTDERAYLESLGDVGQA